MRRTSAARAAGVGAVQVGRRVGRRRLGIGKVTATAGDRMAVVVEHGCGDAGQPGRHLALLGGVAASRVSGSTERRALRVRGPVPCRSTNADGSG